MTKIIKKDLILKKDTLFNESINVKGNIKGYFNLRVMGDIDAQNINVRNINARNINVQNIDALDIDAQNINVRNINARNIDARNINAWNINAWNIDAWDINAQNIDAWDIDARNIICEKRIKKSKDCKTISRVFIQDKSKLERKEQMK